MVWRSAVQSGWVTGDGWGSSEDPLILRVKTNTWTPGYRGLLDLLFSSLLCSSTLTPSDAIWFGLPPLYAVPYLPIGLETVAYCSFIRSSQQDPVPSLFRLCFPIVSRIHLARRRTFSSPSFFTVHISSRRSRLDTSLNHFHRYLLCFTSTHRFCPRMYTVRTVVLDLIPILAWMLKSRAFLPYRHRPERGGWEPYPTKYLGVVGVPHLKVPFLPRGP